VVDLGCGTAVNSEEFARNGHFVVGVDFSYRALAIARKPTIPNLDLRYLNLQDRRRVLEFGAELVRSGLPWHFNLGHVLAGLPREGRENVFLLLRLVLTDEAFAFASFDTRFIGMQFREDNPRTWHLPVEWLEQEAGRQRLAVQVVSTAFRKTRYGRRKIAMAVLRREHVATGQG
jgi:SAM-dependent methyltransferase